mgnify:CR=1 FL=1
MKYLLSLLVLTVASLAYAQPAQQMEMIKRFQNMTPEQMQAEAAKMQQAATQMGACMQNVDKNKLKELEAEGKALHQKIESLCAAGKESEAEAVAMSEGQKFGNDPEIRKMKECAGKVQMPHFDFTPDTKDGKRKSICEK